MKNIFEIKQLKNINLKHLSTPMIIGIIILFLFIILSFMSDVFMTADNQYNVLRSTAIYGIVALGVTFVILTGGIDLSVGSVIGLSGIIATKLMVMGIPISLAILISIIAGTMVGVLNGIIIHYGKVPAFVATLGTMTAGRGLVNVISDGQRVSQLPSNFIDFAGGSVFGLSNLFLVWVFLIIAACFILYKTVIGRSIYAVGSNEESARLSGISVPKVLITTYAISAFLASIAGVLLASRLGSGVPSAGLGYELDAIAATVIGGTALTGAIGGPIGTALGSILLATLRNGGVLLGVNSFILQILIGSLIVIAVIVEKLRKK